MELKKAKELDKYYTKSLIAKKCYDDFLPLLSNEILIEPSAGAGSFLSVVDRDIVGFDIRPERNDIYQHDFINDNLTDKLSSMGIGYDGIAMIGNPPFGKKGALGIDFINTAFKYSPLIGFILPIQFRKWSAQKKINPYGRLIFDKDLPDNSFTIIDKDYSMRCSFQIWSLNHLEYDDLRIRESPPTKHDDFDMWQFNRTKEAEKYFDYDWDFAVPRQGFNDYSYKAFKKEDCDMKKQWIFFKAHNKKSLEILLNIDFYALAKLNSITPGFGKADLVKQYIIEKEKS